jgi:hypothetical protein
MAAEPVLATVKYNRSVAQHHQRVLRHGTDGGAFQKNLGAGVANGCHAIVRGSDLSISKTLGGGREAGDSVRILTPASERGH